MADDETRGIELYIYNHDYRHGIVDSEIGPGYAEFVYDEFDGEGEKWVRKSSIGPLEFNEFRALLAAVDIMEQWEKSKPAASEIVIKIELKA